MKKQIQFVSLAAMIAALYAALTYISGLFGLSSGPVQVRLSEALCVLPYFTPAAIPGLFLGCLLGNLLTGGIPIDVLGGAFVTLLASGITYMLRKKSPFFAPAAPVLLNTICIPFILSYAYGIEGSIPFFMLTVFAGEFISCGILGTLLLLSLRKRKLFLNDISHNTGK